MLEGLPDGFRMVRIRRAHWHGALKCFASTSGQHTFQSAQSMVNVEGTPYYLAVQSDLLESGLCMLWPLLILDGVLCPQALRKGITMVATK